MRNANQVAVQNWKVRGVALVCLLLISWFAFAEATHFHPIKLSGSEERCDFCAVAHANAAAVPVVSTVQVVPDLAPTQVLCAENCTSKSLLHGSALYIRPPPLA